MPTSCVTKRHCGTLAPVWMNGTHPTVKDGIFNRTVCGTYDHGCCQYKHTIQVRQCPGPFYIYKFGRLPSCTLAFCGTGMGKSVHLFLKSEVSHIDTSLTKSQKKTFQVAIGGPQSPFSNSSSFILFFVLLPFFLKTKMTTSMNKNLLCFSVSARVLQLCGRFWFEKKNCISLP